MHRVIVVLLVFVILTARTTLSQTPRSIASIGIQSESLADAKRTLAQKDRKLASSLPSTNVGVFVVHVNPDGGFGKAGIRACDIILRIGNTQITDVATLHSWQESAEIGTTLPVLLLRASEEEGKLVWKRQVISITTEVSVQQQPADNPRPFDREKGIQALTEWEQTQSDVPEGQRPFEIKGDRLGMTFEMFKAKHFRSVEGDPRSAPFCSNERPDDDNELLFYKAEYAKCGIIKASTTYPFEAYRKNPVIPTVAGVVTSSFIYSFVEGELYEMTVFFSRDGHKQVMTAMQAKYGEPSSTENRTYQNAFGATFDGTVTVWANVVSEISIYEIAGKSDQSLMIVKHTILSKKAKDKLDCLELQRADDL